jgi:hypothetical protein
MLKVKNVYSWALGSVERGIQRPAKKATLSALGCISREPGVGLVELKRSMQTPSFTASKHLNSITPPHHLNLDSNRRHRDYLLSTSTMPSGLVAEVGKETTAEGVALEEVAHDDPARK